MFFSGSYSLKRHLFGLNFDKMDKNMPFLPLLNTQHLAKYRAHSNAKKILIRLAITYFIIFLVFACAVWHPSVGIQTAPY